MIICLLCIHENVLSDQTPANLVFEFAGTRMHSLFKSFPKEPESQKTFFSQKNVFFQSLLLIAYLDTLALSILLGCLYLVNALLVK
jgi:hypothetical protein